MMIVGALFAHSGNTHGSKHGVSLEIETRQCDCERERVVILSQLFYIGIPILKPSGNRLHYF